MSLTNFKNNFHWFQQKTNRKKRCLSKKKNSKLIESYKFITIFFMKCTHMYYYLQVALILDNLLLLRAHH